MGNSLTEYIRLNRLGDPELTSLGVLQAASLSKQFTRMPYITHIFSSPCRRAITTALLVFAPILKTSLPVVVVPEFKEHSEYECDKPSADIVLPYEYKNAHIDLGFADVYKVPNYVDCDPLGPSGDEQIHASECRGLLLKLAQEAIAQGRVNSEGKVEIAVVGHVIKLNYMMGNFECKLFAQFLFCFLKFWYSRFADYNPDRQRKNRPWEHTEYRSFEFIPPTLLPGNDTAPEDLYDEIPHDKRGTCNE
jgi:broad specificity phosphatase PhoE